MKRDRDEKNGNVWRFVWRAGTAVGCAVCLLCLYVCFSWYFDTENIVSVKKINEESDASGKEKTKETQAIRESTAGEGAYRQADAKAEEKEYLLYQEYCRRLDGIAGTSQIEEHGFSVIEEHVFPMETYAFGTVSLIPALDRQYHRLALFFADEEGRIVCRTEDLETNRRRPGKTGQLTQGIAAVSFQDVNADGLTDILLITFCNNALTETEIPVSAKAPASAKAEEKTAGRHYKLGDVLFQDREGFYRDVRVSDKLNRFSMNKSAQLIASFVRDGYSAEFLYTAQTFTQLREHGFQMMTDQSQWWNFEKLGRLHLVCGTYQMAEYTIFMVYLVDAQGRIIWSLQPMGDYEHLYALHGVKCCDIDGDGLSDIVILASYSSENTAGEMVTQKDYSIYYQRTDGFAADTQMKRVYQCTEETVMDDLLTRAWAFWGWGTLAGTE